jgi:hypothetical protein
VGTNGFLGPIIGQGRERRRRFALILMGDWCDSGDGVDTATKEHLDAAYRRAGDRDGMLLECRRMLRTRGEVCPLDWSLLLMGGLNYAVK